MLTSMDDIRARALTLPRQTVAPARPAARASRTMTSWRATCLTLSASPKKTRSSLAVPFSSIGHLYP